MMTLPFPAYFFSLSQNTAFLYPVILVLLLFPCTIYSSALMKEKEGFSEHPQISNRLHDSTSQMTTFFIKYILLFNNILP